MSTLNDKLQYLLETKAAIKTALVQKGVNVNDNDTFRSYANKILGIVSGGESSEFTPPEGYTALMLCSVNCNVHFRHFDDLENLFDYQEVQFEYSSEIDLIGSRYVLVRNEDIPLIHSFYADGGSCALLEPMNLKYYTPNISNIRNFVGFDKINFTNPIWLYQPFYNSTIKNTPNPLTIYQATSETKNIHGILPMNQDNSDNDRCFDFTSWDVSGCDDLKPFCQNVWTNNDVIDCSTWQPKNGVDVTFFCYQININELRIDQFDHDNFGDYSNMFNSSNIKRIRCTQKFANWALEHADEINLPDNLRNGSMGHYEYPDLYNWLIVDWEGEIPQRIDLLKITGDDGLEITVKNGYNSDEIYTRSIIENGEAIVYCYDIQLEQDPTVVIEDQENLGIDYIEKLVEGNLVLDWMHIGCLNRIGGIDEGIVLTRGDAIFNVYTKDNGAVYDTHNLSFTGDNTHLRIYMNGATIKLPNCQITEWNGSSDCSFTIFMHSNQLEYFQSYINGNKWVGPIDSNCQYRLYDYDENESYNDRNINLKSEDEWDRSKYVTFKLYDGNGLDITDCNLISVMYGYEFNGNYYGWMGNTLSTRVEIDGYGTVLFYIGNEENLGYTLNHAAFGTLPMAEGTQYEYILRPTDGDLTIELHTTWVYEEAHVRQIKYTVTPVDSEGNVLELDNIHGYCGNNGNLFSFGSIQTYETYDTGDINLLLGACNGVTGVTAYDEVVYPAGETNQINYCYIVPEYVLRMPVVHDDFVKSARYGDDDTWYVYTVSDNPTYSVKINYDNDNNELIDKFETNCSSRGVYKFDKEKYPDSFNNLHDMLLESSNKIRYAYLHKMDFTNVNSIDGILAYGNNLEILTLPLTFHTGISCCNFLNDAPDSCEIYAPQVAYDHIINNFSSGATRFNWHICSSEEDYNGVPIIVGEITIPNE